MAATTRQRLVKRSYQFTPEQLAWIEERTRRLGFASDAENLREIVRSLMDAEREQPAGQADRLAS